MTAPFGPWLPYTQTFTDGTQGNILSISTPLSRIAGIVNGFLPPNAVYDDSTARICCMSHVLDGHPMDDLSWNGTCQVTAPGLSSVPVGGPGIVITSAGGASSRYEVFGALQYWSIRANLDSSVFNPTLAYWADPDAHDSTDPPTIEFGPSGNIILYEYQPFTAIEFDITIDSPTSYSVGLPHVIRAKQFPYSPSPASYPWLVGGGVGAQVMTLTMGAGGVTSWAGSDFVPDATVGAAWSLTSTAVQYGYFVGDDPGKPWGAGTGAAFGWAVPRMHLVVRRTGLRRATGAAPPLHQRQRTDGLGGGPMHQSPGLASRQLGGRARGIY